MEMTELYIISLNPVVLMLQIHVGEGSQCKAAASILWLWTFPGMEIRSLVKIACKGFVLIFAEVVELASNLLVILPSCM